MLNYRVLGQVNPAASANTILYTVTSGASAILSSIMIANQQANGSMYYIAVVPSGQNQQYPASKNFISYSSPVPANDTISLVTGITMGSNDSIIVTANNANVSFSVFGTEIS
jgi:hypothetical protein